MLSGDVVDVHTIHIDQGFAAFFRNDFETALVEFDMALDIVPTSPYARWNRCQTLLALGRYKEGFALWRSNWEIFKAELTERGTRLYFDQHRPIWKGERDARVTILGEAGFGDMIQMLRFVPLARELAEIRLDLPEPMQRFGKQIAPLADDDECDFVCPMFDLPVIFNTIPPPPYLKAEGRLRPDRSFRRIGIAWSTKFEGSTEHPSARRPIPLDQFLALLKRRHDCELVSLQAQERREAMCRGIYAPLYKDFADVASVAVQCDAVVSIDSAALHVAGAICHPNCFAVLPYAATWRWLDRSAESARSPWYPAITLCKQDAPGDWASAFEKVTL